MKGQSKKWKRIDSFIRYPDWIRLLIYVHHIGVPPGTNLLAGSDSIGLAIVYSSCVVPYSLYLVLVEAESSSLYSHFNWIAIPFAFFFHEIAYRNSRIDDTPDRIKEHHLVARINNWHPALSDAFFLLLYLFLFVQPMVFLNFLTEYILLK